jgi:hypothetical protein
MERFAFSGLRHRTTQVLSPVDELQRATHFGYTPNRLTTITWRIMTTTIIFPNGHGGFVEAHEALRLGYDFNGYNLFSGGFRYNPLEVVECKPDEPSDPSVNGMKLFHTETGRVYKAAH